jgi:hypothetical protein
MIPDRAWQLELSWELIERTQALTRTARVQIAQSKATIADSRRIVASVAPATSRASPPVLGDNNQGALRQMVERNQYSAHRARS